MQFSKNGWVQRRLGLGVLLSTGLLLGAGLPGLAQSRSPSVSPRESSASERPASAQNRLRLQLSDLKAPGNLEGAAVRGGCLVPKGEAFHALVPPSQIGLTTAAHPTLMVAVPNALVTTVDGNQPSHFVWLEVSLKDEQQRILSRSTFPLTPQPGIVSLPLPNSTPALVEGIPYQWIITAGCNLSDLTQRLPAIGMGWIQRVAPLSPSPDVPIPPADQPQYYAAVGIWYDAVSSLAALYRQHPEFAEDWQALLEAIDLSRIVDQPFLPCCTAADPSHLFSSMDGSDQHPPSPGNLPGKHTPSSQR
ncbi:DUF928 domain-containing protein [Trichothermofontia sp.]